MLFDSNVFFSAVNSGKILDEPALLTFKNYWMDVDGRRELLVADPDISCNQPIPLTPRKIDVRPRLADYRNSTGTYYVYDIYRGPGLEGVKRGTVKKIRVVGLDFRAAGIGVTVNRGPAAGAIVSTPISIGNGSWDVKWVLGEARVYEDGSAFFHAPARTPLYFQALDDRGYVVQTMRSWSTLQPGENMACAGCHEHKNTTPPSSAGGSLAMRAGPQPLAPFYGPSRGFSFPQEVQPILDRHCIECQNERSFAPKQGSFFCHSRRSGRTSRRTFLLDRR